MPALKNQRWERFCQGIANGMTGDAAYEAAGYKPNRKNASRLKTTEVIIARVLELQGKRADRFVLTKQWLIDAVIENAEIALGRRPVKVGKADDFKEVYVYKGDVANQAVKMLGTEFDLFVERKDVRITNEYSKLSDADLARRLVEVGQQMLLEGPDLVAGVGPVIEHEEDEDGAA